MKPKGTGEFTLSAKRAILRSAVLVKQVMVALVKHMMCMQHKHVVCMQHKHMFAAISLSIWL